MRPAVMTFLLVAALAPPATAQVTEALFNGRDLKGWKTEHAKARVRDAVIRVEPSRGWVRTERPFGDFILTFEIRMRDAGRAGVFVRGWPTFDKDSAPADAFRITKTFKEAKGTNAPWEQWQIECRGGKIRMLVDGEVAYTTEGVTNPHGFIGLWAHDGTAEFRTIHVEELAPPIGEAPGVITSKTPGATIPKLLKEVKPAYTVAAMARMIEGTVDLIAVVEGDGAVGNIRTVRSLDARYGLDESAITALKQWRFTPPTLDGKPVAMLIAVELKFTLR